MTAARVSSADARRLAWAVLALALLLAGGLSAQAARRGFTPVAARPLVARPLPSPPVARATATPAPALPTADHPAPAAGTTGTIALPPLPAAALADPGLDASIVPARPFRFGGAAALDRGRALECLATAIYYEAASEPDAGQQAVAQVVLNRVRHPAFPPTVCGVVYQGSERAGCQFSFACDGSMIRHRPSASGWARAARVAAAALFGRVYGPVGLATHYHTFAVTPVWNRSLVMTDAVGAHFFHRWKGWWGTAAAFRQFYAGGEPVPGPHPSLAPAILAVPVIAAAAAVPPLPLARPLTPPATVQPAYRASGAPLAVAPADDRLPPAAAVLPRWAESGRPLR